MAKKKLVPKKSTKPLVTSSKKVDIERDLGIYKIDTKKEIDITQNARVVYTIIGSQDRLLDGAPIVLCDDFDERALAKKEIKNGKEILYIKINGLGRLANPMSANLDNSAKSKIMKDNKISQFKQVNSECFEQYLIFLKTKNILHYKFAERTRQ